MSYKCVVYLARLKKDVDLLNDAYRRYLRSDWDGIYKAYRKPSSKKVNAWSYCEGLCKDYDGKDLRVVAKNDFFFTAGFIGKVDGKKAFVYITSSCNRFIYL